MEWVLKWPGQLVIAGCQTYWTAEVSEALEQGDLEGYVPTLLSQVTRIIIRAAVLHFTSRWR